jgi:predicted N-formylglutamate amidohydrolase
MGAVACSTLGRLAHRGILYSCEHASRALPAGVRPGAAAGLLRMHWGSDIGAANVTRFLTGPGDAAVLAGVSRLWIDLNRAPGDPSMFPEHTHEGPVPFNEGIGEVEKSRRIHDYFDPFHATVSALASPPPGGARPRLLVSVHSFTATFRGKRRSMEAGVLFDRHDALCNRLVDAFRAQGFVAAANEPYSGKDGLIFSAAMHGQKADIPYFEIELRQDLIARRRDALAVSERVRLAMDACGL